MFKLTALILSGFAALMLLVLAQPLRQTEPDPDLLRLAVRATVHAWPTPEPREVVVTRVVEVTRIVEVTRVLEAAHETETPTPPETSEPAPPADDPTPTPVPPTPVSDVADDERVVVAARQAEPADTSLESEPPVEDVEPIVEEETAVEEEIVQAPAPVVEQAAGGCPATSNRHYTTVPIEGTPTNHPDQEHGDLNLALRGSQPIEGHLGLVEISGPTDGDSPQLEGIFSDRRLPAFIGLHRVNDWNWGCGGRGCRGETLGHPEATLAVVGASPGEPLAPAQRGAEVYGGGFVALVLFADEQSVPLGYTREDSVANGYAVHLRNICVDPSLLQTYRAANGQGRGVLPALRNGETLGTAAGTTLHLAVRDRGVFKDPRSRKDWWARH
jgi:hypothetical protein